MGNIRKLLAIGMVGIVSIMFFSGCDSSREKEERYQQEQMQQSSGEIGMPEVTEFYEKKMAKEILELRDDSELMCYAYSQAMDGRFIYIGRCMGYGLPYSTQYTNPEQIINNGGSIPMADPNGLYSPDGVDATWLMMVNETTGNREVMYFEPTVVVKQEKMPQRVCAEWSLPEGY